jgi:GTP-binding protein
LSAAKKSARPKRPKRTKSPEGTAAATDSVPKRDPLVIRDLQFLGGLAETGGWRPEVPLPEVAFSGRSNVGKSSLLNRLVRRKAFARVSKTPGRTREVNFFQVNDAFILVDLPGYGYARISKERKAEWRPLIETYLQQSQQLRGIVQLIDSRHDPSPDDVEMLDFLGELGIPTIIAMTKTDKLRPSQVAARIVALAEVLDVDEDQIIAFSAVTGAGRDELAEAIETIIAQPPWRLP